jgi:hypothetical protein
MSGALLFRRCRAEDDLASEKGCLSYSCLFDALHGTTPFPSKVMIGYNTKRT